LCSGFSLATCAEIFTTTLKIIKVILLSLYRVWVFLVFSVFMLIFLPGIVLPFFFGQRAGTVGYAFLYIWSWVFSKLTFIRYEFYGRENFRKGHSYIYVSNHTSFLDLPGIRMLIPGQFRPLAKKELLKIPVFGWIAQAATVIVDRSSQQSRKKSIDRLKQLLKDGLSILIFVEGTQNRSKEILQPFHDGAFRIAIDTQRPLLPIVVIGAGKLMPPSTINLRPGVIRIYVAPEIPTTDLSNADIPALKQQTFDVMKELILKHNR
jgi:1-acyl-sn-glycerol-3-phosphate acyltransferase